MPTRRRVHSDTRELKHSCLPEAFAHQRIGNDRRFSFENIGSERSRDSRQYSLCTLVSICVAASIASQVLLPYIIIFAKVQIHHLQEVLFAEKQGDIGIRTPSLQGVIFLEEPLPIEKWKDTADTTSAFAPVANVLKSEFEVPEPSRVNEALAAAKAAKRSRQDGNVKKALNIIEHALILAPNNPDILIEMGQVKELNKDLIEADQCYARALTFDPYHSEALILRAKTNPLVSAIDKKFLGTVHKLKDDFTNLKSSTALRRLMRDTYFLYVYHTVAIEGNTLSLGQTRAILESGMAVAGKSIREHNEVIGMDAALRFLNHSLLAAEHDTISLEDILEMHKRVLGHADPDAAGKIRTTQVYVGRFTPVGPEFVREQMEELIEWLNDEGTRSMDPIERAAIAHYKLVLVHPFTDGNGRTSRLLLNLILMRSGFPPVILPVETKAEYYAALQTANLGDLRPFVRYVARQIDSSLKKYIGSIRTTSGNGISNSERDVVNEDMEIFDQTLQDDSCRNEG